MNIRAMRWGPILATFALLAGVIVAVQASTTTAGAATHTGVQQKSSVLVLKNGGSYWYGTVKLGCSFSSKGCSGYVHIQGEDDTESQRVRYSVPKGGTDTVRLKYHPEKHADGVPQNSWVGGSVKVKLEYRQFDLASSYDYDKWIGVEPLVTKQDITGTVSGSMTGLSGVKVSLYRVSKETSTLSSSRSVSNGSSFTFPVKMGPNNTTSTSRYKLRVSAEVNGEFTSWWWRGSSSGSVGGERGGGRTITEGTTIAVRPYAAFHADVAWGTISGSVAGAREVQVFAPPVTTPSGTPRRELDSPYCANRYGSQETSGSFAIRFLPATPAIANNKRYMVRVVPASGGDFESWNGGPGEGGYGSCNDILDYTYSTAHLIELTSESPNVTVNPVLRNATATVKFQFDYDGFSPQISDRYVSLREYIPNKEILDSPKVRTGTASSAGNFDMTKVRPGKYWAEVGRTTGCHRWYPSIYHNNNLYFKDDRSNERWKTVDGRYAEDNRSKDPDYANPPFPTNAEGGKPVPKGYVGWMYRDVCPHYGAGRYALFNVDRSDNGDVYIHSSKTLKVYQGATISGHVSRIDGKSNKEMLVSAFSTKGKLVMRSAYTNSKGNFKIRGLATGNYRIEVNPDSWRGIGRTFTGTHTKYVTQGHGYSVGTLSFKS
ncbi:carboxypeptidase-like regulatory domain-containing protein [Aeromicrobium terrae]|uniref:Carboxypeptidase regulatory-like domain-containing protein n=1 Tax=Aeromicrobium terrae TaxID=2498846 RepID=A0A5C8NS08_9ACTN|nr:carboxypeptidase-like regulatory domain-containing protein [Aeromicrobium terrae]TXL63253.1 carboxypeptidase regulatory-like domain-containing protein [Aeromicrobium terrae]